MVLISAQPMAQYFIWQLEIQHQNFIEIGYDPKDIYALVGYDGYGPTTDWQNWASSTPTNVIFYKDERLERNYAPSIRPHLLAKFYSEYPSLSKEWCFYHDSDIFFTRMIDWSALQSTSSWKVSDTISYIGYEYIRQKGTDVLLDMCSAVGIPPSVVRANQAHSGGCQYLLHETDGEFWKKVEGDCERMHSLVSRNQSSYGQTWSHVTGKNKEDYHTIQIWCADMWCVLWNAWIHGFETRISSELAFSWGTTPAEEYRNTAIFHNAGITADIKDNHFYKGAYTGKLPYEDDLSKIPTQSCSWVYAMAIQREARRRTLCHGPLPELPKVSCIMATKNRHRVVQRSIACFLAQTYPNKELIIFNNSETPLELDESLSMYPIKVVNQFRSARTGTRYTELGQIMYDAFQWGTGELYSQWDDDDIFLPNHLETGVKALLKSDKPAWKPGTNIWSGDSGSTFDFCDNNMESSVIQRSDNAARFGFSFDNAAKMVEWRNAMHQYQLIDNDKDATTFCYVWNDGVFHISGQFDDPDNFNNFARLNSSAAPGRLIADMGARDFWYDRIYQFLKENEPI